MQGRHERESGGIARKVDVIGEIISFPTLSGRTEGWLAKELVILVTLCGPTRTVEV